MTLLSKGELKGELTFGSIPWVFKSILRLVVPLLVVVVEVTTLRTLVPVGQVALVVLFVSRIVDSETEVTQVFVSCVRLVVHCSV